MLTIVSSGIIIIITVLTGGILRSQFKENHIASCLVMLVTMTKSTLVGILVAIWIPNMVLSTMAAIIASCLLISFMTYKLPIKIFVESMSMMFMGSMMGAMLSLMTSSYGTLSIVFFTVIYILSVIIAVGLWNKDEQQNFLRAIPKSLSFVATTAVIVLMVSSLYAASSVRGQINEEKTEINHHQH